jgi:lysyl-tRNA synthetase class 2
MLEYYQAFADVHDMMALTEELVAHAVREVRGSLGFEYQGQALDFTPPWPRLSMLEAVSGKVGERIDDLDPARLERLLQRHGLAVRPGTGAGGMLDELFGELVQPGIVRPTFVVDFPVEISPLARVSRANPALVERFELLAAGMELANSFSEQNDPEAQARAFELQMTRRDAGDEEAQVMDHDYVRALEYGMPPTGGVGIGIDRLAMLLTDTRSLREVILFPTLRPEEGRAEIEHDDLTAEVAGPSKPGAAPR